MNETATFKMKAFIKNTLLLCLVMAGSAGAQTLRGPVTTSPYGRDFVTAASASDARNKLGVSVSGAGTNDVGYGATTFDFVTASNYNGGTINVPTNMAPIATSSNPTNSYTTNVVYSTFNQRSVLQGSANLTTAANATANMTLFYTNQGVGYTLPMQVASSGTATNIIPFYVLLGTNATFRFVFTGPLTGCFLTNVVLWRL